tara:strand:+ start:26047 stop:28500 length:2454 start_codon:yes stop_codon:yes gene_type:complete
MFQIGEQTSYSTYTEAKFALLAKLANLIASAQLSNETKQKIELWITDVKASIDNHSQDIDKICHGYDTLNADEKKLINSFLSQADIEKIQRGLYSLLSTEELVNDYLIRANESAVPSLLLSTPTQKMQENVKTLSDKLIQNIKAYMNNNYDYKKSCRALGEPEIGENANYESNFKTFAVCLLHHMPDTIYTGGFTTDEVNQYLEAKGLEPIPEEKDEQKKMSMVQAEAIIEMGMDALEKNDNLERTMYIQFTYGLVLMRPVPQLGVKAKDPTGEFKTVIDSEYGDSSKYFDLVRSPGEEGAEARRLISDDHIYKSYYYTQEAAKGRLGKPDTTKLTSCYGILKEREIELIRDTCPEFLTTPNEHAPWSPDIVAQWANPNSPIVSSLLDHEASYVSGPSGTYSILTALHEMLVNSASIEEKQLYIQSALAYIVGTGLHSIHEVLGPAEHNMKLIPGYNVGVPYKGKIPAPNYTAFYDLACENDPEFKQRLDQSWESLLNFHNKTYEHNPILHNGEKAFEAILEKYSSEKHDQYTAYIRLLLDNGIVTIGEDKQSPLIIALRNHDEKLVDYLIEQPEFNTNENKTSVNIIKKMQEINDYSEVFRATYYADSHKIVFEANAFEDDIDLREHLDHIKTCLEALGLDDVSLSSLSELSLEIPLDDKLIAQVTSKILTLPTNDLLGFSGSNSSELNWSDSADFSDTSDLVFDSSPGSDSSSLLFDESLDSSDDQLIFEDSPGSDEVDHEKQLPAGIFDQKDTSQPKQTKHEKQTTSETPKENQTPKQRQSFLTSFESKVQSDKIAADKSDKENVPENRRGLKK